MQVVDKFALLVSQIELQRALAFVQTSFNLQHGIKLLRRILATFGILLKARLRLLDRSQISQHKFGLDGLDIARGVDLARHMNHIRVAEEAYDLADRVSLANVVQELVAQAFAVRSALDQARNVNELDRGRHDAIGIVDLSQAIHARIGHRHDAHVRLDGGERIIRRQAPFISKRGEQR